jgi:hypothetical protein
MAALQEGDGDNRQYDWQREQQLVLFGLPISIFVKEVSMSKVFGRVLLRESNVGIPHLLATLYEATSVTTPPIAGARTAHGQDESRWNRLGSTITDGQGAFTIDYDYDGQGRNGKQRPDLVLVVSAPEESNTPEGKQPARISTCFRRNAASVESFAIRVDAARLAQEGIRNPKDGQDVEDLIEQRRVAAQRQAKLRADSQRLFAERLETRRKFERLAETKFEKFLSALSAVPEERRNLADARYVPRGTSVVAANQAIIQSGIKGRINQASVTGVVALTDDQERQFKDRNGQFVASIPQAEIEKVLKPKQRGRGSSNYRITPPALLCWEGPVDPCVEILEGKAPPDDDHPEQPAPSPQPSPAQGNTGTNGHGLTTSDIPLLIENLVKDMTPPESTKIFSFPDRAGIQQIQQSVTGFTLESGPADAPSLHDFHHLQIAFEHVWHELFDHGVVNAAKDLYTQLVELGVDPNEYLVDFTDPKELIKYLLSLIKEASEPSSEPPELVIKEFDITPEQWNALTVHQGELTVIARHIHSVWGTILRSTSITSKVRISFATPTLSSTRRRDFTSFIRS